MKKVFSFLPLFIAFQLQGQNVDIVFKKAFIDELASKTSLTVDYIVDKSHNKPNSAAKDGDLHFAGRSTKIGMNSVAEIMNAKQVMPTVDYIKSIQGTSTNINITGAWRIWCEHPNEQDQFIQTATVKKATTTNPPHIFEIHPVTIVGNTDITSTLANIDGFEYKNPQQAFARYASTPFEIKKLSGNKVKLLTKGVGYNYVKFKILLIDEAPFDAQDGGTFAMCQVLDEDDEILVPKLRMVFLKDSEPQRKLKKMQTDDVMTVVGIPRISASLIKWRIENYKNPEYSGALTWELPYEMIVVAALD